MPSKISWTEETWNPVHGCSRVSAGCAHCYAETLSLRRGWTEKPWTKRNAEENVTLKPERLRVPLGWREPRVIFVNSMSDLFHELVPEDFIAEVFAIMALTPRHVYQVLTKRPERMRALLNDGGFNDLIDAFSMSMEGRSAQWNRQNIPGVWTAHIMRRPLPNVWLGTSIENRSWLRRADDLRETPAAVRFISAEPLLGPLVYDAKIEAGHYATGGLTSEEVVGDTTIWHRDWSDEHDGPELDFAGIDWVICGGESGPGHRQMDVQWAEDLAEACADSGVSFFMKQDSGARPGQQGRLSDVLWSLKEMPGDRMTG